MKTLRFRSDKVVEYFRNSFKERADQVMAEAAVLELVRRREVSTSLAAELLGLPLSDFLEVLAKHGIPYFTEQPRDTEDLLHQYRALHGQGAE